MPRALTFEQAELIRKWRKQDKKKYTYYKLAALFKVHHTTIQAICEDRAYVVPDEHGKRVKLPRELKAAIKYAISHSKFYSHARGKMLRRIAEIHRVSLKTVRRMAYDYTRNGKATMAK